MRFNDLCNHMNSHLQKGFINAINYRNNDTDGTARNNDMRTQHMQPQFNRNEQQDTYGQQGYNNQPYQPQQRNDPNYDRPPKKHHWALDTIGVLMVCVIGITMWGAHENNQAAQQAQQNAHRTPKTETIVQRPKPQSQQLSPSSNVQNTADDMKSLEQEMQNFQVQNDIQQALLNAYQNQKPAKQVKIYEDVQKPLQHVPSFARPFVARHAANYVVNHYAQR